MSASPDLFGLTFDRLAGLLEADGLKPVHAAAVWRRLYRDSAHPLPPPVRTWWDHQKPSLPPATMETVSSDGLTRKFLLRLGDGEDIETVLMGFPGRLTACVSTQAGCAMGCVFCATGQMGFRRHLTAAEITLQIVHHRNHLRATGRTGLRNVVLMGMGEPLHNYDEVMTALDILCDPRGCNLGPGRITLSTVGHVPGILRLADENRPYHLAVSLHGSTQENRAALVPVARRWPLDALMDACRHYQEKTGRRIFFEWTLIEGKNDSVEEAERLATLLRGLDAHINLIPLNTTGGFAGRPSGSAPVRAFQARLRLAGFPVTIRQRRGIDVDAGCGQLRQRAVQDPSAVTASTVCRPGDPR
jgi:23S rRNA (adenine2503-C2)-methyltransferase